MSKRLPFEPTPIGDARDRFWRALVREYSATDGPLGGDRPGQHRDNVFDFHNGLRMIVSRDVFKQGEQARIHVSASAEPDSHLFESIAHGLELSTFRDGHVIPILEEISQYNVVIEVEKLTETNIPHWIVRLGWPTTKRKES